jgi:alanine dehydrogenase
MAAQGENMTVGIPKEVKTDEFRVGATPFNVAMLIDDGHKVLLQSGAGEGSGFSDALYRDTGAEIVESAESLYAQATLIVKVKEPQPSEYALLSDRHTLFCYLHLAPLPELVSLLAEKRVCAIAYETVALGTLLPIGAGNAGFNAAKIATGMGADVTVLNRSTPKLEQLQNVLPSVKTAIYSPATLRELLPDIDIIISTVLIHGGATTPKLITRKMLKEMKKGSILVDITIDQGGIAETSRPTTHTDPIFVEEGVLHYCVANMPGAYPKTATVALTNATLPYIRKLADQGSIDAIKEDPSLALGVNVFNGTVTNPAVAKALSLEFKALETLL